MSKSLRHYRVLDKQLRKHVDDEISRSLLAGLDYVKAGSKPEVKAQWAYELMERMDRLLDEETCIKVREGCACVQSNEKSIYAKTFCKLRKLYPDDEDYIREVIAYLNSTEPLRRCGEVTRQEDEIYSVIARGSCECSVVREGLSQPISKTWCQCCKGSLLSVYRHVFNDRTCEMDIVRTIATGADECCFVTRYR